jgi:hypothetical protein
MSNYYYNDPDRNGDGWLMIEVEAKEPGPGSIVEVRGELDQSMEWAVDRMLRDLKAKELGRWDPTQQVDDDLLPGVV